MGMFSRANEDWAGCDSGCDYFFANIYDGKAREKTPEELKKEEIENYLWNLEKDRQLRFPRRALESKQVLYEKRVRFENDRFLAHLQSFGTHKNDECLREFYPNKKDKFSCDLYEQGFSILYGGTTWSVRPLHEQKIVVEMPDTINYVTIDIVYRKYPNHRLCIPTEVYKSVWPIKEMVTRKKYKVVGFNFYKTKILRLSAALNTICKNYDEIPVLFVHDVG